MATSGNRDTQLTLRVDVTGEEGVQRLAADVRTLAKEGGDAAPELRRIADDIDRLGAQAGALTGLKNLAVDVKALGAAEATAAADADRLRQALAAQRDVTIAARETQATLRTELDGLVLAQERAAGALKTYVKENVGAAKQTDTYRNEVHRLGVASTEAGLAVTTKTFALRDSGKAASEAAVAETKLAAQSERSNAAATRAATALRTRVQAQEQAVASALALGVATDDLAEADIRVAAQQRELAASAERTVNAQRAQIAAAEKLTAAKREQAAIDAALADLGAQNYLALEKQQQALAALVDKQNKAQAEARELAAAQQALAAATRLTADHTEALTIEAGRQAAALERQRTEAAESAAAMRLLEQAAQRAEAEFKELTGSLRTAEAAAEEYAAATERAASAASGDVQATQARQRAATALLDVERSLSVAQRDLANQRNAGRAALVAEAEAYARAATSAREAAAATAQFVTASQRAGAELEKSFGVLGIRSLDAVKAEIQAVERNLRVLQVRAQAGGFDDGVRELERAAGAAQVKLLALRQELNQVQTTPGQFAAMSASINGLITKFAGLGAAVATVGVAVRPVLEATIALQSTERVLTSVTGSASSAAQQIEFLRNVAQRSGQSFGDLATAYSKFTASALQTGLSVEATQKVFESVALAAGNLGLGTEQAKRALEALSQIASKGVVGMEELRGQLGDALPGVLPLLAKELGLTTAELNKVVESGNLLAGEAIPAIGRSLLKLGPTAGTAVDGLAASFSRFKNILLEAGTTIVGGPLGKAAGLVVGAFAGVVRDATVVLVGFSEATGAVARSVGAVVAGLTGAFSTFAEFKAAVSTNFEDAGKRVSDFKDRAYSASEATTALSKSLSEVAASGVKAAGGTDAQAQSLAKLALEQTKAVSLAESLSRNTETLAQATEKEAKALAGTIALVVDEGEARQRYLLVAEGVAAARDRAAAAADAEAVALRRARQAVLDRTEADEQARAGAQKLIDVLDEKIKKADADAEKSHAQAAATRETAEAAKLSARAYGDQSKELDRLRSSVEAAQAAFDAISRAFKKGKADTDDLTRADRALVEAKYLLNEALGDQEKATRRTTDAIKAAFEVSKAEIDLEITKLRIKQQNLVLRGDEAGALRLEIKIRELELAATKNGTAAKIAEAKALQELILQQYADAESRGKLTPELKLELNTRYEHQRAIILQTEAAKLNEAQTQKTIESVKNGTTALTSHTGATGGNTTAVGTNSTAVTANGNAFSGAAPKIDKATSAMDRFYEAMAKLRGFDGGVSGSGITGIVDSALAARNASFAATPFKSGSGQGGTLTGQSQPPTADGGWTFDAEGFSRATAGNVQKLFSVDPKQFWVRNAAGVAIDAAAIEKQNAKSGLVKDRYGLYRVAGTTAAEGNTTGLTGVAYLQYQAAAEELREKFPTATPAGSAVAIQQQIADLTRAAAAPPAPTPVFDNDTPGTQGQYTAVPILGKYEVNFTANGRTTSAFTDSAAEAQAFIDNLQQAFRTANGG